MREIRAALEAGRFAAYAAEFYARRRSPGAGRRLGRGYRFGVLYTARLCAAALCGENGCKLWISS